MHLAGRGSGRGDSGPLFREASLDIGRGGRRQSVLLRPAEVGETADLSDTAAGAALAGKGRRHVPLERVVVVAEFLAGGQGPDRGDLQAGDAEGDVGVAAVVDVVVDLVGEGLEPRRGGAPQE